MADKIETIDGSLIQHGPHNDRIYLMHLPGADTGHLVSKLDRLAWAHGYGKIFAKIPATHWKAFKSAGYTREAIIPGFVRGRTDGLFIARFFSGQRGKATPRQPVYPPEPPFPAPLPAEGAHRRRVKTAYTIARADSRAINRVFQKRGIDRRDG